MNPEILVRTGSSTGLGLTIAISALVHVMVIAFLIAMPARFGTPSRPSESYTVDLVASDSVGGTNLLAGSRPSSAVKPASAVVGKSRASLPVVAEKPEPAPPVVAEKPKPAPPVVAEKPKPAPPVVAEEPKPVPPVVAEEPKPAPPVVAEKPKPAPPVVAEKPKPAPRTDVVAQGGEADSPDARIARAVAERAAKVDSPSPVEPTGNIDQQISAAIRRRVAGQVAVGVESASAPGGAVSYGPGVGPGGMIHDLEYIAYRGQMEARIKAAWAWAGADRSLVAIVGFNITRAGEIVNVHTVKTSGVPSYDTSAERAVRSANPLGPPPIRYHQEFWGVELEFRPEETRS